jgi:hypothetical protein
MQKVYVPETAGERSVWIVHWNTLPNDPCPVQVGVERTAPLGSIT